MSDETRPKILFTKTLKYHLQKSFNWKSALKSFTVTLFFSNYSDLFARVIDFKKLNRHDRVSKIISGNRKKFKRCIYKELKIYEREYPETVKQECTVKGTYYWIKIQVHKEIQLFTKDWKWGLNLKKDKSNPTIKLCCFLFYLKFIFRRELLEK